MIAHVEGTIAERGFDHVVIDVSGVGFHLLVSLHTLAQLPAVGARARVRTYLHVREDALTLFGFATDEERAGFELCLGVQGVGPKLAMSILSTLEPVELGRAIAAGDHSRLQKIPGIGKKTAERLVLELKDKAQKVLPASAQSGPGAPPAGRGAGRSAVVDAVVSALVNLGYRPAEAERAAGDAAAAHPSAPVERLIKEALRALAE